MSPAGTPVTTAEAAVLPETVRHNKLNAIKDQIAQSPGSLEIERVAQGVLDSFHEIWRHFA